MVQDFYSHSNWVELHVRPSECTCYRRETVFSYDADSTLIVGCGVVVLGQVGPRLCSSSRSSSSSSGSLKTRDRQPSHLPSRS